MRGGSLSSRFTALLGCKLPSSWLLLCLVGVLALLAFLGSPPWNESNSATSAVVPSVYTNYRRLKEQAAIDYYDLRAVSLGLNRQTELSFCGKESEHFVPCYNVTENSSAGFQDGEQNDRHCELAQDRERCLIRPPKEYKIPLKWPTGRDVIWSGNVKIKKEQFLSSGSMTKRKRWIPVQNRTSDSQWLDVHGVRPEDFSNDSQAYEESQRNYWSLLTLLIFSDHPKRPGDEDPLPPYNMVRNVMDMSASYGGLNAVLLKAGKSSWVMNVVPVGTPNTLPIILDRSFAGTLHDWCEPFPTYPRTYDLLHADGLLAHLTYKNCDLVDLFLEMDPILRPEGWVVLKDNAALIDAARAYAAQVRWEGRLIDPQDGSDR